MEVGGKQGWGFCYNKETKLGVRSRVGGNVMWNTVSPNIPNSKDKEGSTSHAAVRAAITGEEGVSFPLCWLGQHRCIRSMRGA